MFMLWNSSENTVCKVSNVFVPDSVCLTLKHQETQVCVVSTVPTDALVHQAISIHNAD